MVELNTRFSVIATRNKLTQPVLVFTSRMLFQLVHKKNNAKKRMNENKTEHYINKIRETNNSVELNTRISVIATRNKLSQPVVVFKSRMLFRLLHEKNNGWKRIKENRKVLFKEYHISYVPTYPPHIINLFYKNVSRTLAVEVI